MVKTIKTKGVRLRIVQSSQGSWQFAGDKAERQRTKDMLKCRGMSSVAASYV